MIPAGGFAERDGDIVATDGRLTVVFDGGTGGVKSIINETTGQVVVDTEAPRPWRLRRHGAEWSAFPREMPPWFHGSDIEPGGFSHRILDDGSSATLEWSTSEPGVSVRVDAVFDAEAGALHLRPRLEVGEGATTPESLTYPILIDPDLEEEGGPEDQFLAPQHSGWLVRRPRRLPTWQAPYPDGYAGCSMQCTAYLQEGVGGLYLATHDPHSTWKTLHFGATEWAITHHTWDLRPGTSVEYGYPVVLAALNVGDWFEVVDRYRRWALGAPWCHPEEADLPGIDREARSWLQEEVGLAIWGSASSLDWSPWYRMWADVAGTPLHVCPGWDWPVRLPQSLGREGWFPSRFHPANVEAWRGHHVTPYMCDLFSSRQAEGFEERWEPNLVYPYVIHPFHRFSEFDTEVLATGHPGSDPRVTTDIPFYMCPGTEAQAAFHAWRDVGLMEDPAMAGVCYDISSGNPLQISRCLRWEHGHPPGRGRHMVVAADRVNRRSKAAVAEKTGRYLVQGVECIIENVIGSVDFYVARAGAGPLGYHEGWNPAHEEPPGTGRELLPLFEAVYHDVGPVRHDGWLTMAVDHGDLFFWAAARIVLQWGALLSLHYSYGFAYNPPERIDGIDWLPGHVNWDGATVQFESLPELDDVKAAFVRELARARTGFASPYLCHGRMLRPITLDTAAVTQWFAGRYSSAPTLVLEGEWDVPEVVHGTWLGGDGTVAIVLAAVGTEGRTVTLDLEPSRLWAIDLAGRPIRVSTGDGVQATATCPDDGIVHIDVVLQPRTVTLVEIGPGAAGR